LTSKPDDARPAGSRVCFRRDDSALDEKIQPTIEIAV